MTTIGEGYTTPVGQYQVELRFKNSRFVGIVGNIENATAAKEFIANVRSVHPQASHYVYAYAAGFGATVRHGMSDGGEPSGTAGRPALSVVRGNGLGDVIVVIVRYFGGTRLGTGGLVKAYTETAQAALAEVPRQQKIERLRGRLVLDYALLERCRQKIAEHEGSIELEVFNEKVILNITIAASRLDGLRQELQDLSGGPAILDIIQDSVWE